MIGIALGMFIAVAVFTSYLQARTLRRLFGYGLFVDVLVWALLLTLFGGTGLERMAAIFASLGVTAYIHTYRYAFGYERIVGKRWVFYPGKFRKTIATEQKA